MFVTISTFIRDNNLSISKTVLENMAAIEHVDVAPMGIKYNEEQLFTLFQKHHFSCILPSSLHKTVDSGDSKDVLIANTKQCVYLMKIYTSSNNFTGKCKIGISSEPNNRAKKISKDMDFIMQVHVVSPMMDNAIDLEQAIHRVLRLKNLNYTANNKFDGSTELFIYNSWMDNLIL